MPKSCDVLNFSVFTITETYFWIPLKIFYQEWNNLGAWWMKFRLG